MIPARIANVIFLMTIFCFFSAQSMPIRFQHPAIHQEVNCPFSNRIKNEKLETYQSIFPVVRALEISAFVVPAVMIYKNPASIVQACKVGVCLAAASIVISQIDDNRLQSHVKPC